jgi:flagellar basal body-associated protein FliL
MDQFTPNQQMPVAPKKSKMGLIIGVIVVVIIVAAVLYFVL